MKLKSFAAMSLAAIMAIGSVMPAFADVRITEATIDSSVKGTITLHKFVENKGRNKQGTGLVDNSVINATLGAAGDTRDNIPLDGIKYSYLKVGSWYQEPSHYVSDTDTDTNETAELEAGTSAVGRYWVSLDDGIFGTGADSILTKLGLQQKYTVFEKTVTRGSAQDNDTSIPGNQRDDGKLTRHVFSNADVEQMLNDILGTPAVDAATAPRTETKAGEVLLNEYIASNGAQTAATNATGAVTISNIDIGLYMSVESDITAHDGLDASGNAYVVRPWDSMTDAERDAWATGETDVYGGNDASKKLTGAQQTEYAGLTSDAARKAFYEALYADQLTNDSSEYKNPEWPVVETRSKPFLISMPMTNVAVITQGGKTYEPGTVWQYDIDAYPKNQTTSVSKRVLDPDDVDNASVGAAKAALRVTEDFMMNEIVHQVIYADVPVLQGTYTYDVNQSGISELMSPAPTHKTFKIKDTMDEGLFFKGATSVKVVLGPKTDENPDAADYFSAANGYQTLTRGTDYTVSGNAGASTFEITLTEAGLKKLDPKTQQNAGGIEVESQIAVFFDCDLDRNAKIGTDDNWSKKGNGNRPTLTWQNSNTEERAIEGNYVYVYTYELDLTKTGLTHPEDVKFEVVHQAGFSATDERNGAKVKWVLDKDDSNQPIAGHYHVYDPNGLDSDIAAADALEQISPAHDGTLNLRGFDSKTYRFKEVATQSGASLLKETFDVSFNEDPAVRDGALTDAILSVDGAEDTLDISEDNGGLVSASVDNAKEISLRTGGEGRTMVFIAGGVAILGLAALGIYYKKRQRVA